MAAISVCLAGACAMRGIELPSGPGEPAQDLDEAFAAATEACRRVTSVAAVVSVSGSVGGRRLRGRLELGLAPPAQARLEALAPIGQPLFIFVARGDQATLLLPRDRRVLEQGRPEAVLEAVTGVPLGAEALRLTMTGCAADPEPGGARAFGSNWRSVPTRERDVYLRREGATGPWRIVAAMQRSQGSQGSSGSRPSAGWRAEYRDFQGGLPRSIRLMSTEQGRFDLRLALSQLEVNTGLGPEVFQVAVPESASPITLEELRRSGPLERDDP